MSRYKYSKNLQNEDEIWDTETDTYFKIHGAIKKLNNQDKQIKKMKEENQQLKTQKFYNWIGKTAQIMTRSDWRDIE